jgi:hypothetical protein
MKVGGLKIEQALKVLSAYPHQFELVVNLIFSRHSYCPRFPETVEAQLKTLSPRKGRDGILRTGPAFTGVKARTGRRIVYLSKARQRPEFWKEAHSEQCQFIKECLRLLTSENSSRADTPTL